LASVGICAQYLIEYPVESVNTKCLKFPISINLETPSSTFVALPKPKV
jgi:hypothetical protein